MRVPPSSKIAPLSRGALATATSSSGLSTIARSVSGTMVAMGPQYTPVRRILACAEARRPAIVGESMTIRRVILAVDDDPRVLDAYQAILESRYEVLTAPDGRAALEVLQHRTVDLVLLDMLMPGLNGLGVLEAMKRLGIETNVVMVSGMNDTLSAFEALRLGASDYLSKPFDIGHLHQVIRRLTEDDASESAGRS